MPSRFDPPEDAERVVPLVTERGREQTLWRRGGTLCVQCPRGTGVMMHLGEAEATALADLIEANPPAGR